MTHDINDIPAPRPRGRPPADAPPYLLIATVRLTGSSATTAMRKAMKAGISVPEHIARTYQARDVRSTAARRILALEHEVAQLREQLAHACR